MPAKTRTAWYVGGLYFQCRQCGNCCSGPQEGYVWVNRAEVELIAAFLGISSDQLRSKYLRRVGWRTSILEQPVSKDCIFLQQIGGKKLCAIYPVRPGQCRTWPFWPENLKSPDAWNRVAQNCPGINRGRFYSYEDIANIKKRRQWWKDVKQNRSSSKQ